MRHTMYGPKGIRLELDTNEVFPDNPGNGTPAMVHYKGGSSTLTCAANEGTVDGGRAGDIELSDDQCQWLWDVHDDAWDWIDENYDGQNGIMSA